jgi:hypothetical protein
MQQSRAQIQPPDDWLAPKVTLTNHGIFLLFQSSGRFTIETSGVQYESFEAKVNLSLRRSTNAAGRITVGFRILERRGDLALGQVTAACPVIFFPRFGYVDCLFFRLGLRLWRG